MTALGRANPIAVATISGGLDSSIVALTLASVVGSLTCVTAATLDPSGDERHYARIVADAGHASYREQILDPGDIDLERSQAEHLPRPVGRPFFQSIARFVGEVATETNASAVFNGTGGDNVFCFLQSVTPIVDRVHAWSVLGALHAASDIARMTDASYLEIGAATARRLLSPGRTYRWRTNRRFLAPPGETELPGFEHPWLRPSRRARPGQLAHVAMLLRVQNYLEPWRADDPVDVINPLLAQPIVEHCLGIPSWRWCQGGVDRAVARHAFATLLPPRVLRRTSSTVTLSSSATYLNSRQQLSAGQPSATLAGTIFEPAHFRGRGGASLSSGAFTASGFATITGGVEDKCALAGLPSGGGKAVIRSSRSGAKSAALIEAYAAFLNRIGDKFATGKDVGFSLEDCEALRRLSPYVAGTNILGSGDPCEHTAIGTLHAIRAVAERLSGTPELRGRRIAVQGLGGVGLRLARFCYQAGASLIVADLDDHRSNRAIEAFEAAAMATEAIHQAKVDIWIPCALGGGIHPGSVDDIKASAIVGPANNQLACPAMAERLSERDILWIPDFLVGAGGVVGAAEEIATIPGRKPAPSETLGNRLARTGDRTRQVMDIAERDEVTPLDAARSLATALLLKASQTGSPKSDIAERTA